MRTASILLFLVACVTPIRAEETLTDLQWHSYFDARVSTFAERTFKVKEIQHDLPWNYEIKDRCKGEIDTEGKKWWKFVQSYSSGKPGSVTSDAYFIRADESGLWNMPEGKAAHVIVPRPLKVGQKWKIGDREATFQGIGDLDLFDQVVENCAIIILKDGTNVMTKHYALNIGLVHVVTRDGETETYTKRITAFSEERKAE